MSEASSKPRGRFAKLLLGVVVGGAVGATLGVALAPKSGRRVRADVRKAVREVLQASSSSPKKLGFVARLRRFLLGKGGPNRH